MATKRERILLVVTPSVTGEQLTNELEARRLDGSEVKLVVPAVTKSAISYWFSDESAVERARAAAARFGARLEGPAARVEAGAGDCDPALAVEDAVATFHPDSIIVIHRSDHPGFRENRLDADRLAARLDREVEEHLIPA